jgi:gamma-glutamylcyclotransferase (GGCT)/AIG2-like uncharacterized protein YtfP
MGTPSPVYYFAYGSNMNLADLKCWCDKNGAVVHLKNHWVAELKDFKLAFTRYSESRKGGVADVVRQDGSSVWGVLFETDESTLKWIDKKEDWKGDLSKNAYKRIQVEVSLKDGQKIKAVTYEVIHKGNYKPGAEYLDLILNGGTDFGLPVEYLENLKDKFS